MADTPGTETPTWPAPVYGSSLKRVAWTGVVLDTDVVALLKAGPLLERAHDVLARSELLAELRGLATSEVADETVRVLLESDHEPVPWEVGEALAEAVLETWHGAIWVWNNGRDRRTANASLPGADLVGLCIDAQGARLLFGEVKSSSDQATPPGVMYGRTGMITQLERLTDVDKDHFTLLRWLSARCTSTEHRELYHEAVARYIGSGGKDVRLVGCLLRDTQPHVDDLAARGASLSQKIQAPMSAELHCWYLPDSMSEWPAYVRTAAGA